MILVSLLSIPYRLGIYDYPQLEKLAFNSKMRQTQRMKFQILDCAGEDQKAILQLRNVNIKDFEDLFNLNANFCILQIDL